ncbi:MAG: class I SAM-dependent methyltransferase [Phaeodactylibacter sp.]|nr:class I SAM-dependent methyltransferase [Phaeodactylibacter sp.]MCB9297706.1 class I SAM-dependent methyltransferase [Lewinellaceae bacterium]
MKLYHELASWWPLLSGPADYAEEAGLYWEIISKYKPDIRDALELGSGGGNNAFHLKKKCRFTLTDISPEMIRVSRELNPDCGHFVGDMREIDLRQQFDLVFIHDAIMFITTPDDLEKVFRTAKKHLKPGGLLFIAPDFFEETFRPSTSHGGHDDGHRSIRYLEWTYDADPDDDVVETEYAYLIKVKGQATRCEYDRAAEGIFPKKTWEALLRKVGFEVSFELIAHSELEPGSYFGIVGRMAT